MTSPTLVYTTWGSAYDARLSWESSNLEHPGSLAQSPVWKVSVCADDTSKATPPGGSTSISKRLLRPIA